MTPRASFFLSFFHPYVASTIAPSLDIEIRWLVGRVFSSENGFLCWLAAPPSVRPGQASQPASQVIEIERGVNHANVVSPSVGQTDRQTDRQADRPRKKKESSKERKR